MSDKITAARDFLRSYLEKNNTGFGEHSAVMALVEYLDENGGSVSEVTPVTEMQEYKELLMDYVELDSKHQGLLTETDKLDAELDSLTTDLSVQKDEVTKANEVIKSLGQTVAEKEEAHQKDIHQRDYNWNELQKAKAKITELELQLEDLSTPALTPVKPDETSVPEETKEPGKPGRPKKIA